MTQSHRNHLSVTLTERIECHAIRPAMLQKNPQRSTRHRPSQFLELNECPPPKKNNLAISFRTGTISPIKRPQTQRVQRARRVLEHSPLADSCAAPWLAEAPLHGQQLNHDVQQYRRRHYPGRHRHHCQHDYHRRHHDRHCHFFRSHPSHKRESRH